MIDAQTQTLLQSADPQARMAGIRQLTKTPTPDAMRQLAQLYRTDASAEVRDLALRAGQYMKRQLDASAAAPVVAGGAAAAAVAVPLAPMSTPADDVPPPPSPAVKVTEADRKRARAMVEGAMERHIGGGKDKAIELLGNALRVDPTLRTDDYYRNMAAMIIGLPEDEALASLVSSQMRTGLVRDAKRAIEQDKRDKHIETANKHSWASIAIDLVLFAIINFAGTAIVLIFFEQLPSMYLESVLPSLRDVSAAQQAAINRQIAVVNVLLDFFTWQRIVGLAALVSGVLMVGLLVQGTMMHPLALMMGGAGTVRYQFLSVTTFLNRWVPFRYLVYVVMLVLLFVVGVSPLVASIIGGIGLAVINTHIARGITQRAREAYHFSFLAGLVASFIAGLLADVVNLVITFGISLVFNLQFATLLEQLNAVAR